MTTKLLGSKLAEQQMMHNLNVQAEIKRNNRPQAIKIAKPKTQAEGLLMTKQRVAYLMRK